MPSPKDASSAEELTRGFSDLRRIMAFVLVGATVLSATWLSLPVEWQLAIVAIAAMVGTELFAVFLNRAGRLSEKAVWVCVLLDLLNIAVVLGASGGVENPFTANFFAYVALAASLFAPRRAFGLAAFSAVLFGALFLVPRSASCHVETSHFHGMLVAFAVAAVLIAVFLVRVRQTLARNRERIEDLHKESAETAKFVALGTLAAGTAHELGTPLSTIAVIAEELSTGPDNLRGHRIASEVERCRSVLARMRPGVRPIAEPHLDVGGLVEDAAAAFRRAHPDVSILVRHDARVPTAFARQDLEAALSILLENAAFAVGQGQGTGIVITVDARAGTPRITVEDDGLGMDEITLSRAGEPFFSTKHEHQGMGLGLFVVKSLLRELGGSLRIEPRALRGVMVTLELPRSAEGPS